MRKHTFPIMVVTSLAAVLFLGLENARGQADDKDAIIAALKKQLEAQEQVIRELRLRGEAKDDLQKRLDLEFKVFQAKIKEQNDLLLALGKGKDERLNALIKIIRDREFQLARLEAEAKELRVKWIQSENMLKTSQERTELLLEQVRELSTRLAKLELGILPEKVPIRDPNEPNPPPVKVTGKLVAVEGDLVQIDLGTDHGVNKNHTLEVYRLKPEKKHLGRIRILDANQSTSVGRFVASTDGVKRPALKPGDIVESTPQKERGLVNPPPVKVDGKIEKINDDLIQISLGTDHGVNKDHTLDVYRIQPQPKYLGIIRIVDASPQTSVGRMVPTGGLRPMVKVGDLVTSKLQ